MKLERLSGLQTTADRTQALEVIVRAFDNPMNLERHMVKALWQGPGFDPENTRIAVADGRVVSVVVVAPRMAHFGPITIPAMTVGPVATHSAYRKQGFSSAVMNDASRHMKEKGALVAYLAGLRGFYHRFGYHPYCVQGGANVKRSELAAIALPGRSRSMTRRDIPRMAELHAAACAGRIMTSARDAEVWEWLIRRGTQTWLFHDPRVILDNRGTPLGYWTTNPKSEFGLTELIVRPDERSWRMALGAMVAAAKKREVKEIGFPLPWDDPMNVFLRQYVPVDMHLKTSPDGSGLLTILDFPALMRAIQPLLTQRWKNAHSCLRGVRFTLATDIGSVGITATGERIVVGKPQSGPRVRVPRRWLSGLVTGHYSTRDIVGREGVRMPASLLPALDILFPACWPHVHRGDNN